MQTTTWILLGSFMLLLGIIAYYISGRKKRKAAYYIKKDRNWVASKPRPGQQVIYSVFLIGDAGAPSLAKQEPTLAILQAQLDKASADSILFFLGDNIYPTGFSKPEEPSYPQAEARLVEQLKITKGFAGRTVLISGNHDWNKGRKGGYESMMRQQAYVDAYFQNEENFLPRDGCPGPVELQVNNFLTIVVINTQWWVHGGNKPIGRSKGCSVDNEHEFFILLKEILDRNRNKKIIVIGHHPMYSKAFHGGRFDLKQHLFPLTELNKRMYIPLPVIGSVYPMYRKYIGSKEDMSHPKYRNLRTRLIRIFEEYDDLIYAAGHDHNLQYLKMKNQHYIVSGAGCKINYVQHGTGAFFTHAHRGFFRLDYYANGDVWLEAWEPADDGVGSVLAYRKELYDNDLVKAAQSNQHAKA